MRFSSEQFMAAHDGYQQELLAPAETLSGYDRWSSSYDTDGNPLVDATAWALDRTPLGCADADVVEMGCGTARHAARALAEGARSYMGVDGSIGMLNVAGTQVRDRRVSLAHANLMAPWTPNRTFDLALLVLVLEHLPTLDPICETLARIVRPGGRVRIVDLHPERIATGALSYFHDGSVEVRFASVAHPVAALVAALEAVGFDVVRRDWLASDAMVTAVPRLAKLRGHRVLLDVKAKRRA